MKRIATALAVGVAVFACAAEARADTRNLEGYVTHASSVNDANVHGYVLMHLRSNGAWAGYAYVKLYVGPAGVVQPMSTALARRMLQLVSTPNRYVQFLSVFYDASYPSDCYAHAGTLADVSALTSVAVHWGSTDGTLRRIQLFTNPWNHGLLQFTRTDGVIVTVSFIKVSQGFRNPMTDLDLDRTLALLCQPWVDLHLNLLHSMNGANTSLLMHRDSSIDVYR